jgi:hypothetical protein
MKNKETLRDYICSEMLYFFANVIVNAMNNLNCIQLQTINIGALHWRTIRKR